MKNDELKLELENNQKEYSKSKRYLEYAKILKGYCNAEDIPVDLESLLLNLEEKSAKLEKEIPEKYLKIKNKNKLSKEKTINSDVDKQSIENLKFVFPNHNKETEAPILYNPKMGLLLVKSTSEVILYRTIPENISLTGKTLKIIDPLSTTEKIIIEADDLSINQIKEKIKKIDLGFNFDPNDLDPKFCLVIGRI